MTLPRLLLRLSVSSPSVNTRIDAAAFDALQLVEARRERVPEPRAVAVVEVLDVGDQLIAIVHEPRVELDLVVERADARLVGGQQADDELLRPRWRSRSSVSVMLPLVSSMTTTVIGCISFSKKTSGCGFSLSKTSKSSCTRSGTRRFCASVTVANSETIWVPDLNVGCCAASVGQGQAEGDATTNACLSHALQLSATRQACRSACHATATIGDLTGRISGK